MKMAVVMLVIVTTTWMWDLSDAYVGPVWRLWCTGREYHFVCVHWSFAFTLSFGHIYSLALDGWLIVSLL